MQEKYSQNTLFDIFATLRKHLLGMCAVFVTIVLIVTVWTFTQTPIYEVVSNVMIQYGRAYFYHPIRKSGEIQPQYTFKVTEWVNTELEIFRSKELAENVIESIGVKEIFPKLADKIKDTDLLMTKAVERFGKNLKLMHIKESNVINVSFQHQDPKVAVEAVNLLTRFFKQRQVQIFKNPQTAFLEKQTASYKRQLQESEDSLKVYKQKNRIFSLEHQQKILMEQYVHVKSSLIEVRSNLSKYGVRVDALEKELAAVPVNVIRSEESTKKTNDIGEASARSSLLKLQLEENQLLEKFPETDRQVVTVRENIALIKASIARYEAGSKETVTTGRNAVFQELGVQLALARADFVAQKAKAAELEQQLAGLEEQLQKLSEQEVQFRELSIQVETIEKTYKNFVGRLEDSRIRDAMDQQNMVNVVVIEKPKIPVKPIRPRKKLNILVACILGIGCSLSYGLLIENANGRKN